MARKIRVKGLVILCTLLILAGGIWGYCWLYRSVPDTIYTEKGANTESFHFVWGVTCQDSVSVSQNGTYHIKVSFANVIPLKEVTVKTANRMTVNVSGTPVGIYMQTQGVMVIDSGEVENAHGELVSPSKNIVKSSDYIYRVNKTRVNNKKELIHMLNTSDGSPIELGLYRNEEQIAVEITPVCTKDGSYKLGIWVRDDLQGIGTLSYIKKDGTFGALGHGINDMDTGELLHLDKGLLYQTRIVSIEKGNKGTPGELGGIIYYSGDSVLGTIDANTKNGIYGTLKTDTGIQKKEYPVAFQQEVLTTDALVLCAVNGNVESYQARIDKICRGTTEENKSFIIEITDPKLLDTTGGIVQGMSGSPIIQNGRFIGAITHVFVDNPQKGYGIFAETMLGEYEK